MRIGELLMLGSLELKPLRGVQNNHFGQGCALGMIILASGEKDLAGPFWGEYVDLPCKCDLSKPIMGGGGEFRYETNPMNVSYVVVHLFNQHVCATEAEVARGIERWTLEQLADCLEAWEPKEEVRTDIAVQEEVHANV